MCKPVNGINSDLNTLTIGLVSHFIEWSYPNTFKERINMAENSITQSVLDSLVSNAAQRLAANGVNLDSDLLADLEDNLSDFLVDKCECDIVDDESESNDTDQTIQLAFDIQSGTVQQTLKVIDSRYNEESIITGLNDGTLMTNTSFEEGAESTIDNLSTNKRVAVIISQDCDCELVEYR